MCGTYPCAQQFRRLSNHQRAFNAAAKTLTSTKKQRVQSAFRRKISLAFFARRRRRLRVTSISEHEQRLVELCQLTGAEALQCLGIGENGLSAEAVEQALRRYGPNVLSQSKKTGVVVEILQRCKNPLVIHLLVICAVSPLMGDVRSAIVVGRMIVLSVVLAHVQEHRSSKAVERLQAMAETTCLVVRDGKECDVQMAEIVPGAMLLHSATRTATPDAACARRAAEY